MSMRTRRRWTANDYDTIEALVPFGLSAGQIGALLDPPTDGRRVIDACRAAGINLGRRRGRPSTAERAEWDRLHQAHLAAVAADTERRERITAFAASLGYVVEIRRMPPEISS